MYMVVVVVVCVCVCVCVCVYAVHVRDGGLVGRSHELLTHSLTCNAVQLCTSAK